MYEQSSNTYTRKDYFMEPKIIKDVSLNQNDTKALIKLWKLLVPDHEYFIAPCAKIDTFTDAYTIDLSLMVNEALPAFTKTIGEKRLHALLRHCGYGVKFARPLQQKTLESELACLRTIENAQHYLYGFKHLINNLATHLDDAPEDMDPLTRAKYVRAYFIFFAAGEFFTEELSFNNGVLGVNYSVCEQISKKNLYPEELFLLYNKMGKTAKIRLSGIEMELQLLDPKLKKKVLEMAELSTNPSQPTYGTAYKFKDFRAVKSLIHQEHCICPLSTFSVKEVFIPKGFQSFMSTLLVLLMHPLSEFETDTRQIRTFENGSIVHKEAKHLVYKDSFCGELFIGGEKEKERYFNLFKYMADKDINLKGMAYNLETGEPIPDHEFEWLVYYALTLFAIERKYITHEMSMPDQLAILDKLTEFYSYDDKALAMTIRVAIEAYWFSDKTSEDAQNLATIMGIDATYEEEKLGIVREKTHEEIILEFAESNNIKINNMDQTLDMINGFWIPNFGDAIAKFAKTKDENVFKKSIGFDAEYASAYFNLVDVDIKKIQEKLLDLKRYRAKAKEMQANGLLIGLYCYLLEGNIPCGPKNRTPERTKALRPENLKAFIAA